MAKQTKHAQYFDNKVNKRETMKTKKTAN
jgi:hypothetical protein